MEKQAAYVTCSRCGYRFTPAADIRCPRCCKPAVTPGGCSGSCSKCLKDKTCHNMRKD
ncbi:hypothetical protein [Desulfoscipio geothermicus]|uniref:hypothetical protein n=1 Tax=Desulfoscipio geothermicus TaxID=39060 RepID=UPI0013F4E774|nr:hypothetical protein [Desulfoscipio geothermicus]